MPGVKKIGFIGLGNMGKYYLERMDFAEAYVFDPAVSEFKGKAKGPVRVCNSAAEVVVASEILVFSLPLKVLEAELQQIAKQIMPEQMVISQGAVKSVEESVLLQHLPAETAVYLVHSMHGPSVDSHGETLLAIGFREREGSAVELARLFSDFGYNIQKVSSAAVHDQETADTQVLTHLCYLSMGRAWQKRGTYPWENPNYLGGIDNIKALFALRLFAGQAHVYGDIAMLNPFALPLVRSYLAEAKKLFKWGEDEKESELVAHLNQVKKALYPAGAKTLMTVTERERLRLTGPMDLQSTNSHLSLLAMASTWAQASISPTNQYLGQTPPYKMRLALVEVLFNHPGQLDAAVHALLYNPSIRDDDQVFLQSLEFWCRAIENKQADEFAKEFNTIKGFFAKRIPKAVSESDRLIQVLKS